MPTSLRLEGAMHFDHRHRTQTHIAVAANIGFNSDPKTGVSHRKTRAREAVGLRHEEDRFALTESTDSQTVVE
jgi:hypothetical protein